MNKLNVFFITDGTKYHDGDMEEVFGVLITSDPKHKVDIALQNMKHLLTTMSPSDAVAKRLKEYTTGTYVLFDWEKETNVVRIGR